MVSGSLIEGAELKIFPQQNGVPLVKKKGESFALTCQVEEGDTEDLRWEKDGVEIPLGSDGR